MVNMNTSLVTCMHLKIAQLLLYATKICSEFLEGTFIDQRTSKVIFQIMPQEKKFQLYWA